MGSDSLSTSEALELCEGRLNQVTTQRSQCDDPHITARFNRTLNQLRAKKLEIEKSAATSRWDPELNKAS
jgi:hypothetical protein